MKIEKINDNQIRCTLTREDLESHQIRISELAYGTDKAKKLFRKLPVIDCCIADLAAAIHHKPDALCPGQLGVAQPLGHHPGNTPCIGRRDQHHILPGLHRGDLMRFRLEAMFCKHLLLEGSLQCYSAG